MAGISGCGHGTVCPTVARSLAGEPAWLLADEPLTGLDLAHQWEAADLLRRHGSLEAAIAHADEERPRVAAALQV